MDINNEQEWTMVKKSKSGSAANSEAIRCSVYKNLKYPRLVITMDGCVANEAGIQVGDYLTVKYNKEACVLQKTDDKSAGFKISKAGSGQRIVLTIRISEDMEKVFFVIPDVLIYNTNSYITEENCIVFLIGRTSS